MSPQIMGVLSDILLGLVVLFSLYVVYYIVLAAGGILWRRKRANLPAAPPTTRFAVLIAARNEEAVIGHLVDSLMQQDYPSELYDVIVAPNNCTDDTHAVALRHGAVIFEPREPIHTKGEVLHQLVGHLLRENRYDAICVFDADNLVKPDFLQRMNNARAAGAKVAQGFRDSKNPTDSAISTCYSVCYWMLNGFYNAGREAMKLSSLVHGCGFMVDFALLHKMGGWHTTTMTEDYEFTAQCVLQDERVHYVPEAIFYDEQPLTFQQSWKQRRRWTSGNIQGTQGYLTELLRKAFTARSGIALDLAVTFMVPFIFVASTATSLAMTGLFLYQVLEFSLMPMGTALAVLAGGVALSFLVSSVVAAVVVRMNKGSGKMEGTGRGILYFAVFLFSWTPITLVSLFKKQTTWDPIHHTRVTPLHEMNNC